MKSNKYLLVAENTTWGEAILGAVKADIPEYEVEEEAEEEIKLEEGEVTIEG